MWQADCATGQTRVPAGDGTAQHIPLPHRPNGRGVHSSAALTHVGHARVGLHGRKAEEQDRQREEQRAQGQV